MRFRNFHENSSKRKSILDYEILQNVDRGIFTSWVDPDSRESKFSENKIKVPARKSCKLTAKFLDISPNVLISVSVGSVVSSNKAK